MTKMQRAFVAYILSSSFATGSLEFIHDYNRLIKTGNSVSDNHYLKKSIPGFFFGALIGPAVPIFYLAGFKALDWRRCPKLK